MLQREIRENLTLYRSRMEEELGISWREALRRGRLHLERLAAHVPDYLAAVQGIAKGGEISEEEAGLLDARYEIFYSAYAKEARPECTSLAVLPERSASGELFLAQNWDWIPGVHVAWLYFQSPDIRVLAFTEAGVLGGKNGINSAGLALCVNGLVSPWDRCDGEGLPFHARTWRVLQSRSLAEAQEIIRSGFSPCSANFLIGQKDEAVSLERAPHQVWALVPNHGMLAHANHFLCPAFPKMLWEESVSSFLRQARAEELLSRTPKLSEKEIFQILSDHHGFPESICRHPEEGKSQYATVLSCFLRPEKSRVLYIHGRPCEGNPLVIELGSLSP